MRVLGYSIAAMLALAPAASHAFAPSEQLCQSTAQVLNTQFMTKSPLNADGTMPEDAGVIVHTIHGPKPNPSAKGVFLDLKFLNTLDPVPDATCGDLMTGKVKKFGGTEIYLPWCGSNRKPGEPLSLSDASSWTYLRTDTLLNSTATNTDEVVCRAGDNKHYGLIFSNTYMNISNNLGCMFPLDGDTGSRPEQGCGASLNPVVAGLSHFGPCTFDQGATTDEKSTAYLNDFGNLIQVRPDLAGSRVCSLSKADFDTWVNVRQKVKLNFTGWPENEFVLRNWDKYSSQDLAINGFLIGIYYLTGCADGTFGNAEDAQKIADLYSSWTGGATVPVFEISNQAIASGSKTPFQCPAQPKIEEQVE